MHQTQDHVPARRWLVTVLIAGLFWLLLPVTFVLAVPAFKKLFDEYGFSLPVSTQILIDLSMWFAEYWWVVAPVFLPFAALMIGLTYLVHRHGGHRRLKLAWDAVLIGFPLLAVLFVWSSFLLVWLKLQEGLRK